MKVFKTIRAARKYAPGEPMIRVGKLYFVAPELDRVGFGLTSVELIDATGSMTGTVTMRHLERLGNANWATTNPKNAFSGPKVFTPETFR